MSGHVTTQKEVTYIFFNRGYEVYSGAEIIKKQLNFRKKPLLKLKRRK